MIGYPGQDFPGLTAEARRSRLARLFEDQPDPLARPGDGGSLVPGYTDSADGQADAADQARMDRQ